MKTQNTKKLAPENVARHFVLDGTLYRKLVDGTVKELTTLSGGQLVTVFEGERLLAIDIAWALHYGNWPMFPVVQLHDDLFDFRIENLFPARLKRLRFRMTGAVGAYRHPLGGLAFATPERCRMDWEWRAREYYLKDMAFVLGLETEQREMRRLAQLPFRMPSLAPVEKAPKPPKEPRSLRPGGVPGMEWHYHDKAWVAIPEACHVADDYRVRIRKQLAGAVRFVFQPEYGQVWGFDENGEVVL